MHMSARLTRDGLVMVDFVCQFGWAMKHSLLNIISGCVCEDISR